jgi:hypothetical protein
MPRAVEVKSHRPKYLVKKPGQIWVLAPIIEVERVRVAELFFWGEERDC